MTRPRTPNTAPARDRLHVYRVTANPTFPDGGMVVDRLIRAPHRFAALQHVASGLFAVRIAKPEDYEELIARGVKIERAASEKPDAPDTTGELDLDGNGSAGASASIGP